MGNCNVRVILGHYVGLKKKISLSLSLSVSHRRERTHARTHIYTLMPRTLSCLRCRGVSSVADGTHQISTQPQMIVVPQWHRGLYPTITYISVKCLEPRSDSLPHVGVILLTNTILWTCEISHYHSGHCEENCLPRNDAVWPDTNITTFVEELAAFIWKNKWL